MSISIIGTGYVGLVAGACFAQLGNEVICVDLNSERVAMINKGKSPIYEEDLGDILKKVSGKMLIATTDLDGAVAKSRISFICVNTPLNKNGTMDITVLEAAVASVGRAMRDKPGHTVVIKSSVLPGMTRNVVIPILEKESGQKAGTDFCVCMNPEFLREGTAVHDFMNPERTVIGALDAKSADILEVLYEDVNGPVIKTDLTTAEMIKHSSNTFLAAKLTFMNELGEICKAIGIDAYKVAEGIGYDSRINHRYLKAGPGYGGSCLPMNTGAMLRFAKDKGLDPLMLDAVITTNARQPKRLIEMTKAKIGPLAGKEITVLGLAFKAGTDDVRSSQALVLVSQLLKKGAVVTVFDPHAMSKARIVLGDSVTYAKDLKTAASNAKCIIVMTDWPEFKNKSLYKGKVVIDSRRVLVDDEIDGIDYEGLHW